MGPLKGLKIIEVSAIGPGPYCGMMQPAPAPRFSRTQPEVVSAPHEPGSDLQAIRTRADKQGDE